MKIKTIVASAFAIALIITVSFSVFKWQMHKTMAEESQEMLAFSQVMGDTATINDLTLVYLKTFSEDARTQWFARQKNIANLLSLDFFGHQEEIETIQKLLVKNQLILDYFTELSGFGDVATGSAASNPPVNVSIRQRQLADNIASELAEMLKTGSRLHDVAEKEQTEYQAISDVGDIVFLFILLTIILFIFIFVLRVIVLPTSRLYKTVSEVIGSKFDYNINLKKVNEIGQLSNYFNILADKLSASYSNLEKQVAERTRQFKSSEQRYRRLFEAAKDGILLIDFETGLIVDVNQFLINLLGFPKSDFVKKHLWDLGIFKDIVASKEKFKELQDKKYVRFEDLPLLTRKGEKISVEFVSNVYDVGGVKTIQADILDIRERKKEAEERREIEQRFRTLASLAPVGIYLADVNGDCLYANMAWCKMAGLTEKQALGKGWVKSLHSEDRRMVMEKWQRMVDSNGEWGMEYRFQTPAGVVTYVFGLATAQRDISGRVINYIGVNLDITDRKNKENILKETMRVLEESQQIANLGNYDLDIATGIWTSSKVLDRIFGIGESYSRSIEGWAKIVHPDDRERMVNYFKNEVVGKGQNFDAEYKITRQYDNAQRWVHGLGRLEFDSKKRPIKMVGTIQDVSDKKETEMAVVALKDQDEAILSSIGDAVVACNTEGNIILLNNEARKLSGFIEADAIGASYKKILKFVKEEDNQPIGDFIGETIARGYQTPRSNHIVIVRSDGFKVPVVINTAPIRDESGRVIGCVVVFHDSTKERKIDKAKTEFVSLASHQLRTPLTSVVWLTEMFAKGSFGKISAKQKDGIEVIHDACRRMSGLVSALLNISRLELGTFIVGPKLMSVSRPADQSIVELRPKIKSKNLKIKTTYPPKLPAINADPVLLKIIWQNLITNAVSYALPNTVINVIIKKDRDNYVFSVSDHGIGIPEEDKSRIFSKFFRAGNAQAFRTDGTGLGLYVVKLILDAVDGKIWFESAIDKGTTFYVSLPAKGMAPKSGTKELDPEGNKNSNIFS